MRQLLLFILLITLISSCKVSHKTINVRGLISCEEDSTVLVHPLITRLSDGKTFIGDDKGFYSVDVMRGDTLVFSYVGAIKDTLVVTNHRLDVKLKPYIPENDEYVYNKKLHELKEELISYISDKGVRIGVAVIINGKDTISVNGSRKFPMMSVFKFPLALTVANWVEANSMSLDDYITFNPNTLIKDTYSPMLKKYGLGLNKMSFKELLYWALVESDNNAADLLFKMVGGTTLCNRALKDISGELDITIGATEREMCEDHNRSNLNQSTPLAMAILFDRFDKEIKYQSESFLEISTMLEQCKT